MLLLTPDTCKVLGGWVDRLIDENNKRRDETRKQFR